MKTTIRFLAICTLTTLPGLAQMQFTGFVGAGPTVPLNPLARQTSRVGWDISAGGGITNNHVGIMLDFLYNDTGINSNRLSQVGAPQGNVHTWGFTLDPVFHVTQEGPVDVYLTGGGGIYHRDVEFSQPGMVEAGQVPASDSVYKGGVDGGVGMSVRLGSSRVKAFAEARYHYIFTAPTATTMIPVTVGLRW